MRYKLLIICSCCVSSLFGVTSLEHSQKRIKDHLLLKDYTTALTELKVYLAEFPQSKELQALMIRTLAQAGRSVEAYHQWKQASQAHKELQEDLSIIESLCWSVLEETHRSSQQAVMISSMIGASLTHDVKAVALLLRCLRSSNAFVRTLASQLCSQYGDKILIEEMKQLLKKESVWYVRLSLIRSLGKMQVMETSELLKEVLASERSSLEEKSVAAEALASMYQTIAGEDLARLTKSPRSGLRYLGCELIAFLNLRNQVHLIAPLLEDPSFEIRIVALNTLAVVGIPQEKKEEFISLLRKLTKDDHAMVSITAARTLGYYNPSESIALLEKYIKSERADEQRVAAVALCLSGKEGREKAYQLMQTTADSFIQANIAYTLLGYVEKKEKLCEKISSFLNAHEEKLMIDSRHNPLFKVIGPSYVRHTPEVSQYPLAVDQHVRLHLLNQLAIAGYPKIDAAMKQYLKKQQVGVTYAASVALLEEGAEDSIEHVKVLLDDPDQKIRVQAALVLALLGGEKKAAHVLQEAYPLMDREFKMHILEALGHIGAKESIPFLLELIDDPFNVMRIIAASSIIQCIYH